MLNLLRQKGNRTRLDWQEFNFLENLLVFCLHSTLRVPRETGISFGITIDASRSCICLLFHIDRQNDPLVTDPKIPRPDYLALYYDGSKLILTIIEMKGGKEGEHAVDQIAALWSILKTEIKSHLPGKLASRVSFQGIILAGFQQQVPLEAIKRQEKRGLVIVPLRYHSSAELFPYVSNLNRLTDRNKLIRYIHTSGRGGRTFSALELLLVNGALQARMRDKLANRYLPARPRSGLYINYARGDGDYCALVANTAGAIVVGGAEHRDFLEFVKGELARVGLGESFEFKIE